MSREGVIIVRGGRYGYLYHKHKSLLRVKVVWAGRSVDSWLAGRWVMND